MSHEENSVYLSYDYIRICILLSSIILFICYRMSKLVFWIRGTRSLKNFCSSRILLPHRILVFGCWIWESQYIFQSLIDLISRGKKFFRARIAKFYQFNGLFSVRFFVFWRIQMASPKKASRPTGHSADVDGCALVASCDFFEILMHPTGSRRIPPWSIISLMFLFFSVETYVYKINLCNTIQKFRFFLSTQTNHSTNSTSNCKTGNLSPPPGTNKFCVEIGDANNKNTTMNEKKLMKCLQTVEKTNHVANINNTKQASKNSS